MTASHHYTQPSGYWEARMGMQEGRILNVVLVVDHADRARLYVNGEVVLRGTHRECEDEMNRRIQWPRLK